MASSAAVLVSHVSGGGSRALPHERSGYGFLNSGWKACPARMKWKVASMECAGRVKMSSKRGAVVGRTAKATKEEVPPINEAERAGCEQRQKESAEVKNPVDPFQWRWTLKWDVVTPNIIVGSYARSPGDVDYMVDEAGIDVIFNLQSGLCFDVLKIPFDAIRKRAVNARFVLFAHG